MSFQRGSLLIQLGRHSAAEQEYRAVLTAEPNNAEAHALLAHCLSNQKKYSEAAEAAKQAITLRPDLPTGYSALAIVYMGCGRLKEAAKAIEQAIALDPLGASDRGVQSAISVSQQDWKRALEAADAGLAIDPNQIPCINARGLALSNLGRFGDAIATNLDALNHNPDSGLIHANQGWALLRSGDQIAAIEHFRESLRLDPNSKWARLGLVAATKTHNKVCGGWFYSLGKLLGKLAFKLRLLR